MTRVSQSVRRTATWGCLVLMALTAACSSGSTGKAGSSGSPIGSTASPGAGSGVTPLNIPAIASPLTCPQGNGITLPGTYVQSDGQQFTYAGKPIRLTGYTFYPGSDGGSAAWRSSQFTQYIDHILDMGAQAGQNLIRPTDYWDKTNTSQQVDDPVIWHNLDYAVCAAKQRGMFVIMDLSAFRWLLVSQGKDPYNAQYWEPFLAAVARHYRDEPAIAFYSILGEPEPPQTPASSNQLVAFYRTLTDTLYAADPHHLISAGGFSHMEEETPQMPWWHQIFALPHIDIVTFKTYSQHDLNLMPAIAQYGQAIHKPLFDEEFGMPQSLGDATFAGGAGYNQITTSRAEFFKTVYDTGKELGVTGFVFWNMGCQIASTSYEVSPLTPAVWQIVLQYAAAAPTAGTAPC
jgi:hypothetical protein